MMMMMMLIIIIIITIFTCTISFQLASVPHLIGKFITRKPISHVPRSNDCDIGFQVQFNVEFTSQVMVFP